MDIMLDDFDLMEHFRQSWLVLGMVILTVSKEIEG